MVEKGQGEEDVYLKIGYDPPRFRSRADRRAAMEFMRLGVACKTLMYTASYNVAIAADGIMALSSRENDVVRLRRRGLSVIIYCPIPEWP